VKRGGGKEKKREKKRGRRRREKIWKKLIQPSNISLVTYLYTFLSILLCASQGVIPRSIQVGLIC
jgi:hypothetical protein